MQYVLVTGAAGGLGYELTRLYAERGDTVFALDLSVSERLAKLTERFPETICALTCDISNTDSVEEAASRVKGLTSHLDRIHNNAGIHRFKDWCTLEETDLDFCKIMFDINAVGPLRIVKALLPLLRDGSVIANTSSEGGSISGTTGVINYAYAMSKAGMNMGARIMDNWLSGRGIRTLMLHPGRMRTGMRGAHSNTDPWVSAEKMISLVDRIYEIPEEVKFLDCDGNPFDW